MHTVLYQVKDHIAYITLNRPESYNSVNKEAGELLIQYLVTANDDPEVRVIALSGSGKAFCSGQDLVEVTNPEAMPGFKSLLSDRYNVIVKKIVNSSKIVVALVNGVAAGAGANIALCCDVVLGKEGAIFVQAFAGIGLVPDSGGSYFLPRLVGKSKAMGMMLLGDKVTAQEADQLGMIYKCISAQEWEQHTSQILSKLASLPPIALNRTKQLLNSTYHNNLENQLGLEEEHQIACSESQDYGEGVAAFLAKRKPVFEGK